MSKTKQYRRNASKIDDDDFEDRYENGYHDKLIQRRKEKKMKSALRSKNLNFLMSMEDDEY